MIDDGFDIYEFRVKKLLYTVKNGGCDNPSEDTCKLKRNTKRLYPDTFKCLTCGKQWEYVEVKEAKDGYYDINGNFVYTSSEYDWRPYTPLPPKEKMKSGTGFIDRIVKALFG